jgi:hypothetical protein
MTIRAIRDDLAAWASDGRNAYTLVDDLWTRILAALRRDPRFAGMKVLDFELVTARVRADAEEELFDALHKRLHLEDAEYVVAQYMEDEE